MRALFSAISLLIVMGVGIWWAMQNFSDDYSLIAPGEEREVVLPTDAALNAKAQMESHFSN